MYIKTHARVFYALLMFPTLGLSTGCVPGSFLGEGGDNGISQFAPNYSQAAPAHRSELPCKDSDSTHLCVALNYVVYSDSSGAPLLQKDKAVKTVDKINSLWAQCHVQFLVENFTAADPKSYGLAFDPSTSDELPQVRQAFADNNRLTVITTGMWNGTLGAQPANAWTEMPAIGPFGVVMESSVAAVDNLIAHELGHYLNLPHVSDSYNVMNPVIFANSLNITDAQCKEARATAISFWGAMLR